MALGTLTLLSCCGPHLFFLLILLVGSLWKHYTSWAFDASNTSSRYTMFRSEVCYPMQEPQEIRRKVSSSSGTPRYIQRWTSPRITLTSETTGRRLIENMFAEISLRIPTITESQSITLDDEARHKTRDDHNLRHAQFPRTSSTVLHSHIH